MRYHQARFNDFQLQYFRIWNSKSSEDIFLINKKDFGFGDAETAEIESEQTN